MSQLNLIIDHIKLLPPNDLVKLIRLTTKILEQKHSSTKPTKIDYVDLIGSGRGSYASPEEANRFIRAERDAWG